MKKYCLLLCFLFNFSFATTQITSGSSVDVGFSPNKGSLDLVLKCINSAKQSIEVAAYSFTSKPIAEALYKASKRGVKVRVIADEKSNLRKYSAVTFTANHNIPTRLNGNYAIFHHKFMIIDNMTLETGSFNFSAAAANRNAENVLVLWNTPQIASIYENEWIKLWNEAKPLQANY